MDVENRKTTLDDDSILYQKRDADSNKKDVKGLDKKGKLQYFIDYYLLKVIVALVVLVVGINLVYTMVFNRQETILNISSAGTNVYIAKSDELSEDLRPIYQLTDKNQVIYASSYDLSDYNQQMAFSTHAAANELDILFLDQEQFERHSEQGMYADLSEVLDPETFEEVKDKIIYGRNAIYDSNAEVSSYTEEYPMAINVTGMAFCENYIAYTGDIYLAFCSASERTDNAKLFLDYVLHPEKYEITETAETES